MEKMAGWEDISNPIEGETGLGKYKVTKSLKDWKHLPGNHFTGGGFWNNIHMFVTDKIISAGHSIIRNYHPGLYIEKVGLVCTIWPYVQVPRLNFD